MLEEKCGSLENELEQLKHSNQILSDDKVDLEVSSLQIILSFFLCSCLVKGAA